MKHPEINFFADEAHLFGSDQPDWSSSSQMGMSHQHSGRRNPSVTQMYNITRSLQQQFAANGHETGPIRHPALGIRQPGTALGAPEVNLALYFGGGPAAMFSGDVPFMPARNGVPVPHSYQMNMPNPIPSDAEEEHGDDDSGTGLTRNFLGAMDRPLNPDYVNQALQPPSLELMLTNPIGVYLNPQELDLDLKL